MRLSEKSILNTSTSLSPLSMRLYVLRIGLFSQIQYSEMMEQEDVNSSDVDNITYFIVLLERWIQQAPCSDLPTCLMRLFSCTWWQTQERWWREPILGRTLEINQQVLSPPCTCSLLKATSPLWALLHKIPADYCKMQARGQLIRKALQLDWFWVYLLHFKWAEFKTKL